MSTPQRKENRITLPPHIRHRAQQRATELGYSSVLEYLSELVVVDTSPLISRGLAQIPQAPPKQDPPTIAVASGDGWGTEI